MNLNDQEIISLSPYLLLSQDLMYSLQEIDEPEERARLQSLCEVRAKQLGYEK